MPWVKVLFNKDDILSTIKCIMCTKMECKEKLFVSKWGSLQKHVGKKETRKGRRLWILNVHMQKWGKVYYHEMCVCYWQGAIWFYDWK